MRLVIYQDIRRLCMLVTYYIFFNFWGILKKKPRKDFNDELLETTCLSSPSLKKIYLRALRFCLITLPVFFMSVNAL